MASDDIVKVLEIFKIYYEGVRNEVVNGITRVTKFL